MNTLSKLLTLLFQPGGIVQPMLTPQQLENYNAVTVRLSPADLYRRALARRARNSEGFGG